MNTLQPTKPDQIRTLWLAVALALVAALAYLLIVWKILGVGDLQMAADGCGSLARSSMPWSCSSSACIRTACCDLLPRRDRYESAAVAA